MVKSQCRQKNSSLRRKLPIVSRNQGRKKPINLFNINFLAPTQNPPFWTPTKKFMRLISWERTQKKDHINLLGGGTLGVQNLVPNGPFRPQNLNFCLMKLVRISGFSSLFPRSDRSIFSIFRQRVLKTLRSLGEKRGKPRKSSLI